MIVILVIRTGGLDIRRIYDAAKQDCIFNIFRIYGTILWR